jgi:glycerol-3-phosphate dehydrogenase (NAD(P)+)
MMQEIWMNDEFRIYPSEDLIGVELGGSLKNIIAIGAGMLDGLAYGDNAKAALITRGLSEITQLAVKMGANAATISGLSGMGDLIVTATSKHSRNYRFGHLLGSGYSIEEAKKEVKMVVEGVYATINTHELAKRHGVIMPIVEAMYEALFEQADVKVAIYSLMTRPKKKSE